MSSCTSFASVLSLILAMLSLHPVHAGPRYIAIPIDGVDVIELNPISPNTYSAQPSYDNPRVPRHSETYVPIAVSSTTQQQHHHHLNGEPVARAERATAAHILDYVDFGAHTGPNGAFSWYADYPSHH